MPQMRLERPREGRSLPSHAAGTEHRPVRFSPGSDLLQYAENRKLPQPPNVGIWLQNLGPALVPWLPGLNWGVKKVTPSRPCPP